MRYNVWLLESKSLSQSQPPTQTPELQPGPAHPKLRNLSHLNDHKISYKFSVFALMASILSPFILKSFPKHELYCLICSSRKLISSTRPPNLSADTLAVKPTKHLRSFSCLLWRSAKAFSRCSKSRFLRCLKARCDSRFCCLRRWILSVTCMLDMELRLTYVELLDVFGGLWRRCVGWADGPIRGKAVVQHGHCVGGWWWVIRCWVAGRWWGGTHPVGISVYLVWDRWRIVVLWLWALQSILKWRILRRQICLRGGLNSCLEVVTFQRRGSRYMEPSIEPFGEDAALDVLVCDCS